MYSFEVFAVHPSPSTPTYVLAVFAYCSCNLAIAAAVIFLSAGRELLSSCWIPLITLALFIFVTATVHFHNHGQLAGVHFSVLPSFAMLGFCATLVASAWWIDARTSSASLAADADLSEVILRNARHFSLVLCFALVIALLPCGHLLSWGWGLDFTASMPLLARSTIAVLRSNVLALRQCTQYWD